MLQSANTNIMSFAAPRTSWHVECVRNGKVIWVEDAGNLVTRVGCNGTAGLLDATFKGGSTTPTWYIGLIATNTTFLTTDTMSSHGTWTESVPYSNANRPTWTPGTISTGADLTTVDNSGSPAAFNINASAAVLGCFFVNNNTKSGTTGILYGEVAFSATRNVVSGDTLNVTVTLSVTAG